MAALDEQVNYLHVDHSDSKGLRLGYDAEGHKYRRHSDKDSGPGTSH